MRRGECPVIQRRGKFPVQQDFYKDWEGYKNGFGNLTEEFWLGNENIYALCLKGCEIRFDLQDEKGIKGFALYQSFSLSSSNYRLSISGYTGNVGDSMKYHNNNDFSTKDKGDTERAIRYKVGWWHGIHGYYCKINGLYQPGKSNDETVSWFTWRENQNLASVEVKVRPK
ncbi:Techylectin-5B [Araneus ventricosus]|uniref:Techylectin-5B n=1 Tax=Araneus ventricosus TaxID=182803 RepID=A0A4Y2UND4_ARAVE|nr:Techylectin-5B [Araneus ventricosus]